MIASRFIFALLPVFFILVLNISTAPILDLQLLPTIFGQSLINDTVIPTESLVYEDNDSSEEDLQTTTIGDNSTESSRLIISGLSFKDIKNISLNIDEILDLTARLLHDNSNELPSTPTTENPTEDD